MKSLRLAAILMLAGGATLVAPAPVSAQVNQLDADFNVIPDKVTLIETGIRISVCLVGIPTIPLCIDSVDLKVGPKIIKAVKIVGVEFEKEFEFDDTGVKIVELDFPFSGKIAKTASLTFHTTTGDVVAPARQ